MQLLKDNVSEVAEWCTGKELDEITDALDVNKKYVGVNLITAVDGIRRADEGDYIVKDNLGDFHIRWPDNFERDYTKVGE